MKKYFINDDYEMSHGKAPRGHGTWVFRVTGSDGVGAFTDLETREATGTFGRARAEAARAAVAEAKSIGGVRELIIETLG